MPRSAETRGRRLSTHPSPHPTSSTPTHSTHLDCTQWPLSETSLTTYCSRMIRPVRFLAPGRHSRAEDGVTTCAMALAPLISPVSSPVPSLLLLFRLSPPRGRYLTLNSALLFPIGASRSLIGEETRSADRPCCDGTEHTFPVTQVLE